MFLVFKCKVIKNTHTANAILFGNRGKSSKMTQGHPKKTKGMMVIIPLEDYFLNIRVRQVFGVTTANL